MPKKSLRDIGRSMAATKKILDALPSSETDISRGKVDSSNQQKGSTMTDRTTAQIAAVNIEAGSRQAFASSVADDVAPIIEWLNGAVLGDSEGSAPEADAGLVISKGLRNSNHYALEQAAALVEGLEFNSTSAEFNRGTHWAQREIIRLLRSVANAPLPEIR